MRAHPLRLLMLLLGLVATLASAPLRQAEAAADLGRALAELVDLDDEIDAIEPIDGGVGDDPSVALAAGDPSADSIAAAEPGPLVPWLYQAWAGDPLARTPQIGQARDRVHADGPVPRDRQALLGRFRF